MKNNLINESSTTVCGFSSTAHAIEIMVADNKIMDKNYFIPKRYYENKLSILPVNKKRVYFYWEFTEDFLHKRSFKLDNISFHIVDQKENLIDTINCDNLYGEYFYNIKNETSSLKELQVIAVYQNGNVSQNIMESNKIKVFNKDIIYPQNLDQIFMKKIGSFQEIIKTSLEHINDGISSASYIQEIERLKEYSNITTQHLSSKDLGEKI